MEKQYIISSNALEIDSLGSFVVYGFKSIDYIIKHYVEYNLYETKLIYYYNVIKLETYVKNVILICDYKVISRLTTKQLEHYKLIL